MPLSEYERRALGEIEAAASTADPHWAEHMAWPPASPRPRRVWPRRLARSLGWFIVGFGLLTLGITTTSGTGTMFALAGYLIIVMRAAWLVGQRCTQPRGHGHE